MKPPLLPPTCLPGQPERQLKARLAELNRSLTTPEERTAA
jgi:hypothetical protein